MATKTIGELTAIDAGDFDDTALVVVRNNDSVDRKATIAQLRTALATDRVLYQNSNLSTTSTSDTSLASYELPAGTLGAANEMVRITVRGRAVHGTGNPHAGTVAQVNFGATGIVALSPAADTTGSYNFVMTAEVSRTGAATQIAHGSQFSSASPGANLMSRSTPAETLANAITIDFRGNADNGASTDGQLFFDTIVVELLYVS